MAARRTVAADPPAPDFTDGRRPPSGWSYSIAALASLLFGLGLGLNFGVSNENTYLLGGLHLLHPDLLAHDWLTTQTTSYHRLFAYPVAALLYLDSSGWLFAIMNVLFLAIGAAAIFKLVQVATAGGRAPSFSPQILLAFVLVLLPALATRTLSVAESTLYTLEFEPSTLGATGFIAAMYLFARRRYLLSGIAIAAGGIFHANYLILAFPAFFMAHLLVAGRAGTWRGLPKALLRQFAIPLAALIALLPIIVPIALQPGSAGTGILLSIRSPHHYQPAVFREQFVPFLGWLLLFAAGVRRAESGRDGFSPLVALGLAMTALIAVATALTTFVYVSPVAQAYVWRLAPMVVVLALVFTARMVSEADAVPASGPAGDRRPLLQPGWRALCVVVAAECFTYYYWLRHRDTLVLEVLGGILVVGLAGWAAGRIVRRRPLREAAMPAAAGDRRHLGMVASPGRPATRAVMVVLIVALAALALVAGKGLSDHSNLLAAATPESRLYSWARASTDKDSVFLIPPGMESFRLSAERAVVVDWKSTPFAPRELEEWYRRVDAVSGEVHPRTPTQADQAYAALADTQLAGLVNQYGVSYVVRRTPLAAAPPAAWRTVFENESYVVLQTGAAAEAAPSP